MTPLESALAAIPTDATPKHYGWAWGLMHGYDAVYHDQAMRAVAVESEFRVPIYNLGGKQLSKSRTFEVAGKIDVDAVEDGRRYVLDHKTTSDDLGPDSTYWQQLAVEGQASLYILAQHLQGVQVAGAIWDVIRKPGIRPKALSKAAQAAITCEPHTYCGFTVTPETVDYVTRGLNVEDSELFGYRVAFECRSDPNRYFARRTIPRLESELTEYAAELWDTAKDVLTTRQTGRNTRSSGSCMAYGRACEYLGICSGYDTPESDKWQKRASVHSELTTLECDGRDVLSHSRIRCYQTCKRKAYYRYELGIERQDREEAEALYFGTLLHRSLEGWWNHYLIPQEDHNHGNTNGDETAEQPTGCGQESR